MFSAEELINVYGNLVASKDLAFENRPVPRVGGVEQLGPEWIPSLRDLGSIL